jgi:TIR domain
MEGFSTSNPKLPCMKLHIREMKCSSSLTDSAALAFLLCVSQPVRWAGKMADVFISYRRRDNSHAAGRLYGQLAVVLGSKRLFMDVDNIPPGADFVKHLEQHVSKCKVMLAVMGKGWLNASDEYGARRLWDANDFVRIEITAALRRNIPVVPILVDAATMPKIQELPYELHDFLRRQAVTISHENFATDVAKLARNLGPELIKPRALTYITSAILGLIRGFRSSPEKIAPLISVPSLVQLNPIQKFYKETINQKSGATLAVTDLYQSYCYWCEKHLVLPVALPEFAREFSGLGVRKEKIAGRVRYIGIELAAQLPSPRRSTTGGHMEAYVRTCITRPEGESVAATEFYEDYCSWCESQSIEPIALPSFGREIAEYGIKRERIAGRIRYLDIALRA